MSARPTTKEELVECIIAQMDENDGYAIARVRTLAEKNKHLFPRSFYKLMISELVAYQFDKTTWDSY